MILRLNKIADDELNDHSAGEITAISIEGPVSTNRFEMLQRLLHENQEIKISLVVEPDLLATEGRLVNLEIIRNLTGIRHLDLLCFASSQLRSLQMLDGIKSLRSFRLSGNYDKKIDLGPLKGNKELIAFELDFGLATKSQIEFVNGLSFLQSLKVSVLDAAAVKPNPNLLVLHIGNTLKNEDRLSDIYPNLRKLVINIAKGLEDFNFLIPFNHLIELIIGHTGKLKELPQLNSRKEINDIKLLFTPNFSDVESILQFENLEGFVMSEFTDIPFEQIEKLTALKKLKRVYLNYKDTVREQRFYKMAEKHGWENVFK